MGRPTKLTPEVQARIVQAISVGATYTHAASFGGVSYDAFNDWMRKGDGPRARDPYRQFCHAVKEAEGAAVVKWLARIEQAASDGTWQAAAWKLERRYPGVYGRRVVDQRVSVDDLRQRAIAAGLDPDQVVAEAEALSGLVSDSGS